MSEDHLTTARRWLAEALGLAVFVAFSLSAAVLAHLGVLPALAADALMPGLVILALVYGLSDLSGARFNPVVTLAFAVRGSFPWERVPGYLAAQFLGACGGVWLVAVCLTLPKAHELVRPWGAFGLETVCTALLLLVILATAKRKAEVGSQAGLVIARRNAGAVHGGQCLHRRRQPQPRVGRRPVQWHGAGGLAASTESVRGRHAGHGADVSATRPA